MSVPCRLSLRLSQCLPVLCSISFRLSQPLSHVTSPFASHSLCVCSMSLLPSHLTVSVSVPCCFSLRLSQCLSVPCSISLRLSLSLSHVTSPFASHGLCVCPMSLLLSLPLEAARPTCTSVHQWCLSKVVHLQKPWIQFDVSSALLQQVAVVTRGGSKLTGTLSRRFPSVNIRLSMATFSRTCSDMSARNVDANLPQIG